MKMMHPRGLLTSNLRETTLRKIAWYLKVPPQHDLDSFFHALPTYRDEGEIILTFSKYTRALAGDDPELPPDDAVEEKRNKLALSGGKDFNFGVAATTTSQATSTNMDKSFEAPTAATSTGKGTTSAVMKAERGGSITGPASKKRKLAQASVAPTPVANLYPIIEEGRRVAAKVDDEWIMMTVIKFNKRTKMYTLEDADDQAEKADALEVHRDLVVPLASSEYSPPMYPAGSRVLAVFPGTTSFYPAVVSKVTKRALSTAKQQTMKPIYDYQLQFDDDDEDDSGETIPKKVKGEMVIEEVAL